MQVKPMEPKFEYTPYKPKLDAFSDLTEVQKLPPLNLTLTPEEILFVRDFIGLEFPHRVHDVQITDMNNIQCVCSAFQKMTDALKSLGLDVAEFNDI